jgi:uncharacterized linocin/CFP29 family protein
VRGPLPDAATVPAEVIDTQTMTVEDAAVLPLVELSVEFGLTEQQVEAEAEQETALTLATRAGNLLAQAEDLLIFQGDKAQGNPLFATVKRRGSAGRGLLASAASDVNVEPAANGNGGTKTVEAVVKAYGQLQRRAQAGPYGLVLGSEQYADTFEPLANTLALPIDRLRPLVTQGLFGTGSLPESAGLVLSLGGATLDLVVGADPTTTFLQVDGDGVYRFRVFERFAVRLKDPEALVRLDYAH